MNDKGFTTIILLCAMVLFTSISVGIAALLRFSGAQLKRWESEFEERMMLHEEASRVIALLVEDETPASDSPTDRVWEYVQTMKRDRLSVALRDISSRYGINWVRKDILDYSGLLRPGKSSGELQQYRWDMGPVLRLLPEYGYFFPEASIRMYFTPYSYFNINISDEFIIERIVLIRTGDRDRARLLQKKLHEFWETAEKGRPVMLEASELSEFLGNEYSMLFPVINAEPAINIHFAPEDILYHLFLFHHHDMSSGIVDHIIRTRNNYEWDSDALELLIGPEYRDGFLHHYIGVTTWFWELQVNSLQGVSLRMVLARVPSQDQYSTVRRYRVIEEEYM
jgi:hypothetical protein